MTVIQFGLLAALTAQVAPLPPAPRYERPIAIAAPGPQRLAVDATLLAGSAPFTLVGLGIDERRFVAEDGLSDLRLFTLDGTEVPYLLVHPPVRDPQWLRADVQPVAATEKTSGFEADLGSVQTINGIDVRRFPGTFMKRFSLEASADREHWTLVIPEGTLFDLPDERLRQTEASFAPGAYRYLRLTWDDTHSARVPLPAGVLARLATADAPPPPLVLAVPFERRPSEPGHSRYHVTLPGPHLPLVALRLDAGGTYVFRRATVTEPRLAAWQAAPVTIGEGLLVRDQSGGTAAAPLRLRIEVPSEAEIDVLVEDADNQPLDLRGVSVEFAELPWIYFEASGPLLARYGDLRLTRPSYDLEAARASLKIDVVPEARWASTAARPLAAPAPPPDLSTLTGGPLDVSSFRYSRDIGAGSAGLLALPLDAAVLAHSAGPARQFADVRIVDATGRQVPRLVERRPEPLLMPLRLEPATPKAPELQPKAGLHRSIYRIALPYGGLPEARLVVSTTARVFRRQVEIGYERGADRGHRDPWFSSAGAVDWSNTAEAEPAALTLPLLSPSADATDLMLVIDEGDNSPLPISSVQLVLPSYRLRFVRPSGATRLVYGSSIDMPRYDLALLASAVLGAAVTDVTMAPEAATTTPAAESLISPRTFWIILIAAVIALLGVLAALLRRSA